MHVPQGPSTTYVPACSLAGDGGSVSKCAAEPKGPSGFSALQRPAGVGVTQFTGRITLAGPPEDPPGGSAEHRVPTLVPGVGNVLPLF